MAAYTVDVEVYSANACFQMEKVFPFMLSNIKATQQYRRDLCIYAFNVSIRKHFK